MNKLKKFLLFGLCMSFAMLLFIGFKACELMEYNTDFPDNKDITLNLSEKNNNVISQNFIENIEKVADDNKVSIFQINYEPNRKNKKTKVVYYVYDFKDNSFYKNLSFTFGHKLNNNDTGKFISNQNTGNPAQSGQINIAYNENIVEIRPLIDLAGRITNNNYIITSENKNIGSALAKKLADDYKYNCSVNTYGTTVQLKTNLYSYAWLMALLLFFDVLIFIAFLYMLVSRYKEFSIMRLLGNSNTDIINSIFNKECLSSIISAILIGSLIFVFYIKIYNGFMGVRQFAPFLCKLVLAYSIIWILLFYISSQCIRAFKLNASALKGEKNPLIIKSINVCVETIFLVISIIIGNCAITGTIQLNSQIKNMKRFEEVKDYATFGFSYNATDVKPKYLAEKKIYRFYSLLNNKGGIMFAPGNYFKDKEYMVPSNNYKSFKKRPDYAPDKCMVSINNNYLKLNPIYDTKGNPVNISDENTTTLTVLVPEKYKSDKKDIQQLYTNFHTFYYYWFDDLYKNLTVHLGYDPSNEKELLSHHQPLPVSIKFVKNNQGYYSYTSLVVPDMKNMITDPIAVIVNNHNMGQFLTSEYVVNGYFMGKSNALNYMSPMQTYSFQKDIDKAGVRNILVSISPSYDASSQFINTTKDKIGIYSTIFFVSIMVVILAALFSCINYMNDKNKEIAIKKINGFSFWPIYKFALINQFFIWCAANILFFIVYSYCINMDYISLSTWLIMPVSIGALIIQSLVFLLTIKANEPDKINETLKGA